MYARVLALRNNEDVGTGLFTIPEPPPKTLSFRDRGFSFIPIREAHLDFMRAVYARAVPSLNEVIGRAMVDENYLPLGMVMVYFERGGKNWLYAHFGRWLKIYPKDILRAMHEVSNDLGAAGVSILHASADESVSGSDYLLKWLGAEPTGEHDGIGPIYRLDLHQCKI
jgi:hypothetical protein